MKKLMLFMFFIFFMHSLSAEITFSSPDTVYNFGDSFSITAVVKSDIDTEDVLRTSLICDDVKKEIFPTQYLKLKKGKKKEIDIDLSMIKTFIGEQSGSCKIKIAFGKMHGFSNEFLLSNVLDVSIDSMGERFNPGEEMVIKGGISKANKKQVKGFAELDIDGSVVKVFELNDEKFELNFLLPGDIKAGRHSLRVNVYEEDLKGEITNKGYNVRGFSVSQIPSTFEVLLDEREINAGKDLKVKAVLRDQSGEKISSEVSISVKNKKDEILGSADKSTDEFVSFFIEKNEAPGDLFVTATSNNMSTESKFRVRETRDISSEIFENTLVLKNTGNVLYDDVFKVKIGGVFVNFSVNLDVGEQEKFVLTAPDGNYKVEVLGDSYNIELTGNVIGVKNFPSVYRINMKNSIFWIFMIFVLGFMVFMVFKKGYKKTFIGYIPSISKYRRRKKQKKNLFINPRNRAKLSLSISGEKQSSGFICLNVKNFSKIKSLPKNSSSDVIETLRKVISSAEENKAFVYDADDNIIFILSPLVTKTFRNEKNVLKIAMKIKGILSEHNKSSKNQIEFGISLNNVEAIVKQSDKGIKFMSFGKSMILLKRIASLSKENIFLGEDIKKALGSSVGVKKKAEGNLNFFEFKEIKFDESGNKFVNEFLSRMKK